MILQIHDELLISVADKDKEIVAKLAQEALESVVQWSVPLVATIRFGKNWDEVTK